MKSTDVLILLLSFIQTRMQSLVPDPRANYRNVIDAMYRIVRYEGIMNSFRGINAMAYGAGPAHALYFACYEHMKKLLCTTGQSNHIAHGTYLVTLVLGSFFFL
jgi:solute carrier family 25 iron transporter 28/37